MKGGKEGELDEDSQKVQISSYKISTRDVMYNMTNLINTAECYIRQLLKEQILPSHYKEKIIFFFFFYFASIGDGGCSLNLPWSSPHDV